MIVNSILIRIKEYLEANVTEAKVIKIGRFQESPLVNKSYIAISAGNVQEPNSRDGIVSLGEMNNIAMYVPAREVGGGQFWWRRGTLDIGYYTISDRLTEEEAFLEAYTYLGKIQSLLDRINVGDLIDEYGERAMKLYVYSSTFIEGGGPPKAYLFRGQMFWQVLTARK